MLIGEISDNECESLPQEPLLYDELPGLRRKLVSSPTMDECPHTLDSPRGDIDFISAYQTPKATERFITPQAKQEGTSSIRPVDGSPALRHFESDSGWSDCGVCKKKAVGKGVDTLDEAPFETSIPEQNQITWLIKDFSSFRHAAQKASLPPLISPDIGTRGLKAALHPFWRKGDIKLDFRLPECINSPAATYCLSVLVLSPLDGREIISHELTVTIQRGKKAPKPSIRLWKKKWAQAKGFLKLLVNDQLTIIMTSEVYDHNAAPFIGISPMSRGTSSNDACLLQDIREFCESHPTQTVEIACGSVSYTACRFLLQARSKKMRVLLADRDSNWQKLELRDIEPSVLEQILGYIHTNTCDYIEDQGTEDNILLKLLAACSTYHIPSLAARVCDILISRLQMHNVLTYWETAKGCDLCSILSQACCQFLDSLPGSRVADMMKKHSNDGLPLKV